MTSTSFYIILFLQWNIAHLIWFARFLWPHAMRSILPTHWTILSDGAYTILFANNLRLLRWILATHDLLFNVDYTLTVKVLLLWCQIWICCTRLNALIRSIKNWEYWLVYLFFDHLKHIKLIFQERSVYCIKMIKVDNKSICN